MKKKLKVLSGFFLIVLFLNYYGCSTFFVHTHQTPFGPITHSHPYKGAHSHSNSAYVTIALLTNVLFNTTSNIWLGIVLCQIKVLQFIFHQIHPITFSQHVFLRAPPITDTNTTLQNHYRYNKFN